MSSIRQDYSLIFLLNETNKQKKTTERRNGYKTSLSFEAENY